MAPWKRLELYAGKLARTVLRGLGAGNRAWLPDEDRSRIRTGHGPENVTRLRRFAIGVLKGYGGAKTSIAEKMRRLHRNTRLVFDYLRMTKNSNRNSSVVPS